MDLFDYISRLSKTSAEATWCQSIFGISDIYGYEKALIGVLPTEGTQIENAFLRSNYGEVWRNRYDRDGMALIDPTVAHSMSNTTPLIWTPHLFSTSAQKAMYEEAQSHGLRSGVTLPMRGPAGEIGMICFVTSQKWSATTHKEVLQVLPHLALLRDVIAQTGQPYFSPLSPPKTIPTLTPRETECLKWVAAGKSSWDIANILHCSEATVNFHLKNVRHKLGVASRHAAAIKAVKLGLITSS